MSKPKVYIDGQAGTTGLEIVQRLQLRDDIQLILIDEDKRHDPEARKTCMDQADLVFLCLPDQASKEAMEWIDEHTRVIDASTAHRVDPGWVYGFPELSQTTKENIHTSRLVANPGCHATGFISIVYPLIQKHVLSKDAVVSCTSLTGYSGGGRSMIQQYESKKTSDLYAPRIYGLNMEHKHLKEMQMICGLEHKPLFCPVVDDYYRGMLTTVMLPLGADTLYDLYQDFYQGTMIKVYRQETTGYLSANEMAHRDDLEIWIHGHGQQAMISARFDNLGKGACGAAIQNMNIMFGFEEMKGLHVK